MVVSSVVANIQEKIADLLGKDFEKVSASRNVKRTRILARDICNLRMSLEKP